MPGQIQKPVCGHGLLTLTFFNKIHGELFGCSICALELQEAPGEQAALHRPEQGEEHGANLPMGPTEHQQLTLQESRQSVQTRLFRDHSEMSLPEQLLLETNKQTNKQNKHVASSWKCSTPSLKSSMLK